MSTQTLVMILAVGPAQSASGLCLRLAAAARRAAIEVRVFLYDDGIYNALAGDSNKNSLRTWKRLMDAGVEVVACANMAKARGVTPDNLQSGVRLENLPRFMNCTVWPAPIVVPTAVVAAATSRRR